MSTITHTVRHGSVARHQPGAGPARAVLLSFYRAMHSCLRRASMQHRCQRALKARVLSVTPAGVPTCASARCPRMRTRASGLPGEGGLSELLAQASELCRKQAATLQRQVTTLQAEVVDALTPKERGDMTDWFLMIASTAVFTFMSMHLYRLYAFVAYPHMFH